MKITIEINLNNASFADDNCGSEISRILKRLSNQLETKIIDENIWGKLYDWNGNPVGKFQVINELEI